MSLNIKVEVEFIRVRPQPYCIDLFASLLLKSHPNCIFGKYVAFESDILNDILIPHYFIAHSRQGVKLHVNFGLTSGGDFIMVHLECKAVWLEGHEYRKLC
jgi:hypothetical protein